MPDIGTTYIVIFGGTGDLSRKKLFPALLDLHRKNLLPDDFTVIGFSRRDYSDEDYRAFIRDALTDVGRQYDTQAIDRFCEHVRYTRGFFDDVDTYRRLSAFLEKCDNERGLCGNRLFYLAVPPRFYSTIFDNFRSSKLNKPCSDNRFTHVLVEKPFGSDLETARELDGKLSEVFKEDQIFRIDHYVAKDAVQNIITFRFSNALFDNAWNHEHIEKVHIKMFEDFGVEERGAFYDKNGALRDVGQNHLLQLLAVTAMDNPDKLESTHLQTARARVLTSLRAYTHPNELIGNVVRAQYQGYHDIENISDGSETETYFLLKAFIDNHRWKGVPFYLESGKELHETKTEVTVYFKSAAPCVCGAESDHEHQDIVTLHIKPRTGISFRIWVKKPGITFALKQKDFAVWTDDPNLDELPPDAYEKVLYDAIVGDQTLFTSSEEVEAAWAFITPILENWESVPLHTYVPKSRGPDDRLDLED